MIINDNGIDREATEQELAEIEAAQAKISEEIAAIEAIEQQKKKDKESAVIKLEALGLTVNELKALGL